MTFHPGYIYFLRPVGQSGPVKIGWSQDPARRLIQYQRWSPVRLEIVATIVGSQATERRFHALWFDHHSHHEWFHAAPVVIEAVRQIVAGTFDLNGLPRGRNLYGRGAPLAGRWTPTLVTSAA